ncbi:MAG: amidohydrolase family protein [Chloroflexi bacterium]|nr:amidohydrolase family protein [Chloroflexota bacterium]
MADSSSSLVNAHTHLELGCFAHLCPPDSGASFVPWIIELINARRDIAPQGMAPFRAAVEAGIETLRASGTTVVGDITATGESVGPLLDGGLNGIVYYEVLGLNGDEALGRLSDARRKINEWRRREGVMRVGLSVHALYSCHPDLFREGARWCVAESVPLCVHAAESPAEIELLVNGTGDFREYQRAFNFPDFPIPGLSPIAYLEDLGVLEARPLLVHCVEVSDDDIARIARSGSTVAHCPRSNARLRCRRMPLEKFLAAGVAVALGTDSLSSSPSLDVREEAEAAIALHAATVPADSIRALLDSPMPLGEIDHA